MTENIKTRFVVVTDSHWNQDQSYNDNLTGSLSLINDIHQEREIDFVVHNGDIVHDDENDHQEVINQFFSDLPVSSDDWYVVFGNHDWSTDSEWQSDYGQSKQHTFEYGDYGFIITNTAEPRTSDWYCADPNWIEDQIDGFSDKNGVFVFQHIPPFYDDDEEHVGVDCPDVRAQFARNEVKGVFLGHNHDKNWVENWDGGKYLYCNRIGGSDLSGGVYDPAEYGLRVFDINN